MQHCMSPGVVNALTLEFKINLGVFWLVVRFLLWLSLASSCLFLGAGSYREPSSLRPLLGESLCSNRPFLVSLFEGVACFGFLSSLLRLVELKPADPLRTNTNLYRSEVTKMPSQMQSVSYTKISCRG